MPKDIKNRSAEGVSFRADDEGKYIEFAFTDESVDRHGTVLKADGLKIENYLKNPIVCYQHMARGKTWEDVPNPDTVIGKVVEIRREGNAHIAKVELEPADINPLAETIRKKIEFGSINCVSVGFKRHNGGYGDPEAGENPDIYYYRDWELLEISIVIIPSNTNAVKRSLDIDLREMTQDELEALSEDLKIRLSQVKKKEAHPPKVEDERQYNSRSTADLKLYQKHLKQS